VTTKKNQPKKWQGESIPFRKPPRKPRLRDPVSLRRMLDETKQKLDVAKNDGDQLREEQTRLTRGLEKARSNLAAMNDEHNAARRDQSAKFNRVYASLQEATKEVEALKQQVRHNTEMQARIDDWNKSRQEGRDLHRESSRQNVNLRTERSKMILSIMEIIAELEQIKDHPVAMVAAKLRGLIV
jgi:chromosome segregation ATPase